MPQKIGLIAELDLSKFNRAVSSYVSQVNKMQTTSQNVARAVSSSFSALSNQASNSLQNVNNAISRLNTNIGSLRSQLGVLTSLTQQLNNLTSAANKAAAAMQKMSSSGSFQSVNLGGVGGALGGIGMAAGGILGGIAGIGGAIASLAGGIGSSIAAIVGSISGLAGTIFKVFGSIVSAITGVIRAFFSLAETIVTVVGSIIRSVASLASTVVKAFSSMVSGVLRIVGSLASTIINAFSSILSSVANIVGNIVSSVVNAFGSLVSAVTRSIQGLVGSVVNIFGSLLSSIGRVLSGIVSSVVGIFSSLLRSVSAVVGNIASSVLGIFGNLAKSVASVVESMARTVVGIITGMVRKVADTLKSMASNILDAYKDLGSRLIQILTVSLAAVTGAVVLAGRQMAGWLSDAIAGAAEFEQNMADIASVLRVARKEVQPLADLITKLGLDPQLVVSTEEAAAVVEQLSRNGIEMTQILDGAAESAILLANATGGDFAKAADVATMAMQMFGLQATEVNRIADVSQGVINNSRIELEDWALALGNGGAAAGALNVTLEDFATAIAGTVNLYHTARQAGTGLTNFLERLVPLTKESADQMKKLGLFTGLSEEEFNSIQDEISKTQDTIDNLDPRLYSYDQLLQAHTDHIADLKKQLVAGNNAFFDQNGKLKSLAEVSEILTNATKGLSDEEKVETFRRIFGNDALETAIGLANLGADAFNDLQKQIAINGSAADAAATRTKTLAARWKNLGDIWATIQRQSGDKFQNMLLNLVNRLTALTNVNQDRIINFFGKMADVANKFVDAVIPIAEKYLPVLIDNLEALAYYVLAAVSGGDDMNNWLGKMSPGLRTFVEKIAGTVEWLKKFSGQVLDFVAYLGETFRPVLDFILQNVQLKDVLIAAAGAIMLNVVPGILRLVGVAILAVRAVATIRKAWEDNWGGIRSFFEETWPKIQKPVINFLNNILTGQWEKAWNDALAVARTIFESLKTAIKNLNTPFTDFIVKILEGRWSDAWEDIRKVAQSVFEWVKNSLKNLDNPFIDFVSDILEGRWYKAWRTVRGVVVDAFDGIVDALDNLDNPFTEFIADLIRGRWFEAWDDFKVIFQEVKDGILFALDELNLPFTNFITKVIRGDWSGAWQNIVNVASTSFELLKTILTDFNNPWSDFLVDILEGNWGRVWSTIQTVATDTLESIKQYLPGWGQEIVTLLQQLINGDWSGAWSTAKDLVFKAIDAIFDYLVPWLIKIGAAVLDFAKNNWREAWNFARDVVVKILEEIKDYTPEWGDHLISALEAILHGDWVSAWNEAKASATSALDELKAGMPLWGQQFITVVQDLINGEWQKAWDDARSGASLALEKLKELTPNWFDPFLTSVQLLLNGEWLTAWETARGAAIDVLKKWELETQDGTWIDTLLDAVLVLSTEGETNRWSKAWALVRAQAISTLKKWELETQDGTWIDTLLDAVLVLSTEGESNPWAKAWALVRDQAILTLSKWQDSEFVKNHKWLYGLIEGINVLLDPEGDWVVGWKLIGNAAVNALVALFSAIATPLSNAFNEHKDEIKDVLVTVLTPVMQAAGAALGQVLANAINGAAQATGNYGVGTIPAIQDILEGQQPKPILPTIPSVSAPTVYPEGYTGPGTTRLPGQAAGTDYWKGGLTWVGEKGPELISLPRGTKIFDNITSMAMAKMAPISTNYSYQTTNSPIQFGPIYVSDKMGMAEFEYRVEQIIDRKRGGI